MNEKGINVDAYSEIIISDEEKPSGQVLATITTEATTSCGCTVSKKIHITGVKAWRRRFDVITPLTYICFILLGVSAGRILDSIISAVRQCTG